MKSHHYQLRFVDVARLLGGLLVVPILFAVAMRLGVFSGALPSPWPALDVDHTILTHQARASRSPLGADVLCIGDSSCLMDVAGGRLQELFGDGHRVLNLGTFMYVGFNGYAAMLARHADANPGRLRTVVLLVHPETLRGSSSAAHYVGFLSDYYAGADPRGPDSVTAQLRGLFGLNIFQNRLLSRTPLPLPKEWGRFYGFNLNLDDFMRRERGSAVDPHQFVPAPGQGNAEYHLAPALKDSCASFRAALPPDARLVVGLTPVPESFAQPDHDARCQRILAEWAEWTGANMVLTNLPATLPDHLFASTTHLNEKGRLVFTEQLARNLGSLPGMNNTDERGPRSP